jgi:hypothetical protein
MITQIQPILFPGNLGTADTIRVNATISNINNGGNPLIAYDLSNAESRVRLNSGVLQISFEDFQTINTSADSIVLWACTQLGVTPIIPPTE